ARARRRVRCIFARRDSWRCNGADGRALARTAARNLVRDGDAGDDAQPHGGRDHRAPGGQQPLPVRAGDRLWRGAGGAGVVRRTATMRTWLRRTRGERGTALIETAFVLPIMLLVCVGILEFGRAYQTWQVV